MGKYFNNISSIAGIIGGIIAHWLGGFDVLLKLLIAAIILDYITGLVKSVYNKELSSNVGFKGICKKVTILLVVAGANIVQQVVGDTLPIREMTICFFVANELISLLENAAMMDLPIPAALKNVLLQIRKKGEGNEPDNS